MGANKKRPCSPLINCHELKAPILDSSTVLARTALTEALVRYIIATNVHGNRQRLHTVTLSPEKHVYVWILG